MLWRSRLSGIRDSLSVGVAPCSNRIVVGIIITILQFQVIHFLEQGLIHLHVVPGCEEQDSLTLDSRHTAIMDSQENTPTVDSQATSVNPSKLSYQQRLDNRRATPVFMVIV